MADDVRWYINNADGTRTEIPKGTGQTYTTKKAKEVLKQIDPVEAGRVKTPQEAQEEEQIENKTLEVKETVIAARETETKQKATTERIVILPEAARALKDISEGKAKGISSIYGKTELQKGKVPTGQTLPGGKTEFYTTLSEPEYFQYSLYKDIDQEKKFYEAARRPEPLYAQAQVAPLGSFTSLTNKEKQAFKAQQQEIWKEMKEPKKVQDYTYTEAITNPDAFYKAFKDSGVVEKGLSFISRKTSVSEEDVTRIYNMYTPFNPLAKVEGISIVGKGIRAGTEYAEDIIKTSEEYGLKQPITISLSQKALTYTLKSEGRYMEERPISFAATSSISAAAGFGFGAVENYFATSTLKGFGPTATKITTRALAAGGTIIWGKERGEAILTAETPKQQQVEFGKTITEAGVFTLAFKGVYKPPTGKGPASVIDEIPKDVPKAPKGKFNPYDYFIKTVKGEGGRSKFYRINRQTGKAEEINRADIFKYKDIFGLKGKKGTARTPEIFRPKPKTEKPADIFKPTKTETTSELIKVEEYSIRRPRPTTKGEVTTIIRDVGTIKERPLVETTKLPPVTIKEKPISVKPTFPIEKPKGRDIFKPTTDLTNRPTSIIRTREYPIKEIEKYPIKERPRSDITEIGRGGRRPVPEGGGGGGGGFPIGGFLGDLPNPFGGGGPRGKFKKGKRTPKGRGSYLPSLSALAFGIEGTAPTGKLSGLEFRPISKKKY